MRSARRLLLVFATLAGILAAPVLPAHGRAPHASIGRVRVDTSATAVAPGLAPAGQGWRVSAPFPAADAVLVGADWGGAPQVEVQVRARPGRRWGPWQPLELDSLEHGPQPGSPEAARDRSTVTRPVWVGQVEALQVRRSGPADPPLTLHTIALRGGDGVNYLPPELGAAGALAAPGSPTLVPRRSWDPNSQCAPRDPPSFARDVRFAYIHHTATSNDYTAAQGPSQVLAICLYHRNSRGWDDLGYNFVVDRYGNTYEGRAGGAVNPVIGAHAAGFNAGSTGVSMLGSFGSVAPPAVMRDALRRLLAWKLDLHHVDPLATTTEISGGGSTNRVPAGRLVALPTILGHRDTGETACPGTKLYEYVTGPLRREVAALGAPKLYGGPPALEQQPVIGARPRWRTGFSQRLDWRLVITNSADHMVRSTGGTAAPGTDLRWDLRDLAGREVPPGRYTARLQAINADATPITTSFTVTPSTERRAGLERIDTAVALSRWAFDSLHRGPRTGFAETSRVVIASAEDFPDALVASPLAASYGAPVLLSNRSGLPATVGQEIRRLGATEAYLVGGPARLSTQVETELKRDAGVQRVERLAGATRYHTAARVAARVIARESPREALLALGEHPDRARAFQDALIGAAFGGAFDLPLLLVAPRALPEPTRTVLASRSWSRGVTVVGGRDVLAASVKAAAGRAANAAVREHAGADAYHTSSLVAEQQLYRWSQQPPDPHRDDKGLEVVVVTGENWPDALAGGAAAAARGASFLLVHGRDLQQSKPAADWLNRHRYATVHAVAAGGSAAVADAVLRDIDRIIRSGGPHTQPPEQWAPDPWGPVVDGPLPDVP